MSEVSRRLGAEALGTAALLAVVVGSGIMGERLSVGNAAIALLANSIATGCGLAVLISIFGPVSGAHFNPAVSMVARLDGDLDTLQLISYGGTQVAAAFAGVAIAHLMFDLPALVAGTKVRTGTAQWLGRLPTPLPASDPPTRPVSSRRSWREHCWDGPARGSCGRDN